MNSAVMSTGVPIATGTGERRKGKWTYEEEAYATRLIRDFKAGILPLRDGASLRAYLAEKLNCEPMRITKKFARTDCIGKVTFRPASLTVFPPELRAIAAREAEELRGRFLLREAQGANWANAGMAGAAGVMSPMAFGSTVNNFAANMGNHATFPLAPPKGMPNTPGGGMYPSTVGAPAAGFSNSPGGMVSDATAAAAAAAAAVQLHPNTSSPLCSPHAGSNAAAFGAAAHGFSGVVGLSSPANSAVGPVVGNAIGTPAGSERVDLKSKSKEDNEAGSILLSFIAKAWSNSPKCSPTAAGAAAAATSVQQPARTAFVPAVAGNTAAVVQAPVKAEGVAKGKRALEVDAAAADAEAAQRVGTDAAARGTDSKPGENSFKRPKTEASVPQALAAATAPAASDSPVSVHLVSKASTAKIASASTVAPSVADDVSERLADAQQKQSPSVVDAAEASPASDDADSTQSEPVVPEVRQTRRARAAAAAASAALTLSA